ncbi:T9SS C-terminal target domain-containing protein [Aquimarina sp. AD10]|nr:T9SS C-terminal target domain-containing protein [Aquimarina sp. AD10]RKM96299.1 glycosyl hydrolase family protein [Aquimarina sp. AD10]
MYINFLHIKLTIMKNLKHTILLVLCIVGFQLTIAQPTPPNGKKWEKVDVLSDEFNGNSLNTSKWLINDPQWEGRRPARFETSSVSVSGGNLKISASKKSNPFNGWTHSGGLVRAKTRSLYGYYETRMKANKTFMSSTFWLINKRNEFTGCDFRTTELDITETVGVNSNGANWVNNTIRNMNSNTHSRGTSCNSTPVGIKGAKAALGGQSWQAYHTYGVWWKSKTEVLFYLDGKFVNKVTPAADFNLPMYLRMVVETYDWNPPKAGADGMNDSAANRTTLYDWVRSYKLVDCNSNCGGNPDPGSSGTVTMKGQSINKFISSENGNRSMRAVSNSAGGQEKFIVKSEGNGTVSFKGNNGKYVSSEDGKKAMNCNRNAVGAWEKFTLVPQGGNVYAIRGNNGKYVSHENGSNNGINCNRNAIGSWEKFVINGLNKSKEFTTDNAPLERKVTTYPNPIKANGTLNMSFELQEETKIAVTLYNIAGQQVLKSNLGTFKAGSHDLKLFDRSKSFSNGIYILKVKMNDIETLERLNFR